MRHRTKAAGLLAALACLAALPATAQPRRVDIAPPAQPPGAIVLKTPGAQASATPETWTMSNLDNVPVVQNVSVPTLTPFLPPRGKASGAAVIVAPGGGFVLLAMDHEGWAVAKWLQSQGVAAFVLKYRVLPTEPGAAGLDKANAEFAAAGPAARVRRIGDGARVATEDAQEAMRVVRARAAEWGLDPHRVGFMGFSAGAITTMSLTLAADPATRPDFIAPVYGGLGPPLTGGTIPDRPPPMWASQAADDPLFRPTDFSLVTGWQAKGGAVELHLYEKGGHGYGFPGRKSTSSTQWPADFLAWMKARGLLDARK
ncbi:MAG: alpha/beta hydrolase fold domain-containing protein [Phenylobacterium sp.]|uniref:alpha/beta hydrolase n=1 Tax=Phenylobacterium sp. TaxID=1871053 RepID=UPI001A60807D|nr:alpha/beta hydrolase [Phenylobacterium sp.]MBL8556736.1 alpha/beta hydrolase fold domain-containing protein [Phenylobacterium sp.]